MICKLFSAHYYLPPQFTARYVVQSLDLLRCAAWCWQFSRQPVVKWWPCCTPSAGTAIRKWQDVRSHFTRSSFSNRLHNTFEGWSSSRQSTFRCSSDRHTTSPTVHFISRGITFRRHSVVTGNKHNLVRTIASIALHEESSCGGSGRNARFKLQGLIITL